ncbi:MAG: hypothetical protein DRG78_23580 [Epsilonproteobacteria bacterium]|nr:MAG: hypothetical protein DRG78_23580 [Campylobacterota bacterium]
MKSKLKQGSWIIIIFVIFIVDPLKILPLELNHMYSGIVHPNSLLFIGLVAIILCKSIDKDIKDANKEHTDKETGIKEAINIFENYFEDKITTQELVKKSKKNETVKKIINILKYGGTEDDLILGVQKVFTTISSKYIKLKNDYEYLATIMPIIGMIGTIAGLLIMFAVPEGIEDFANKFSGLSIALATTLYASFITILIFKPKARSVEEWLVSLDTDYEYSGISIKQFYHKVDILELIQILENEDNVEAKN